MPFYKCPRCGRVVKTKKGVYYCRECGPGNILEEIWGDTASLDMVMESLVYAVAVNCPDESTMKNVISEFYHAMNRRGLPGKVAEHEINRAYKYLDLLIRGIPEAVKRTMAVAEKAVKEKERRMKRAFAYAFFVEACKGRGLDPEAFIDVFEKAYDPELPLEDIKKRIIELLEAKTKA